MENEYGVIQCPECGKMDAVRSRWDTYWGLFKARCNRCGYSFNTTGVER